MRDLRHIHLYMHVYTVLFCVYYGQQNVAANARAHEHSLFGAARPQIKNECGARGENFEIFREVFISRTMVLYHKLLPNNATTSTLNVHNFDKVARGSRP